MNLNKPPFEIKIINHGEVRMGSPYNTCEIELIGINELNLPKNGWQDIFAWSTEFTKLVLIKWNFDDNIPGFHLFLIDPKTYETVESPKLLGLPDDITLSGNKVNLTKFLYDKEKSKAGELCCQVKEEYIFN